jgi:hypothetical protein
MASGPTKVRRASRRTVSWCCHGNFAAIARAAPALTPVIARVGESHYREAAGALAREIEKLPGLDDEIDLVESLLS